MEKGKRGEERTDASSSTSSRERERKEEQEGIRVYREVYRRYIKAISISTPPRPLLQLLQTPLVASSPSLPVSLELSVVSQPQPSEPTRDALDRLLNSREPLDSAASSFDVLDETGEGGLLDAAG